MRSLCIAIVLSSGAARADLAPPPAAPPGLPPPKAETTRSGLKSVVLRPGTGKKHPGETDTVTVHYTGWTSDGNVFDSSVTRGLPASFALDKVIAGWTEGVQLMVEGEKRRLWIPEELAYKGHPGAPQGRLIFDVELLSFREGPRLIPAPPDVAAPPRDASKTASGLAWKLLKRGGGATHPTATQKVEVHYTGWTPDGKMFDSSVTRGTPATFPLNRVIAGWTEGVQLLVEGDKARFWIPAQLAYGDKPGPGGRPAGMLVFDVELIKMVE